MVLYKNSLKIIFLSISISFLFQGCLTSNQDMVKPKEKIKKTFSINYALAKKSGYAGYTEYKSIEKFTSEYEYNHIDINNYRDYVISNKSSGTYAYKFLKIVGDIEVYQPDIKYGWILALGIKQDKKHINAPLLGSPLLNVGTVSFLGESNYKTKYGVYKKILIFDRAKKFREASTKAMLRK